MVDNILQLARKNIQKLKPYESARRIEGSHGNVWLNANESPMSVSFKIRIESFNRYPECQPNDLVSSYARYVDLCCDQILVTRGADEGIELLIKAFCEPRIDSIIYCPPTYDMYGVNARIANVEVKEIPTIKDTWQLDLSNIEKNLKKVKLIYICNPNNPTGNAIIKNDLIDLLNITIGRALIIIDEAYIEFIPEESMTYFLKKYPNLVILRTLSKAFALAGIRCGFTLAHKEIINILNKVITPYPISIPIFDIAMQSLESNYIKLMTNRVFHLNSNRSWLMNELRKMSCVKKVFDSSANYVLVKFFMFKEVFQFLWDKGIILRNQSKKIHLNQCIRISVGTREECFQLIDALKCFSK